jgi:hypothetical protein
MDLAADGNGNGTIDTADYDVWRAHFGNSAAAATHTVSDSFAVPEPPPIVLACFVLAAFAGTRRAQHRFNITACRK